MQYLFPSDDRDYSVREGFGLPNIPHDIVNPESEFKFRLLFDYLNGGDEFDTHFKVGKRGCPFRGNVMKNILTFYDLLIDTYLINPYQNGVLTENVGTVMRGTDSRLSDIIDMFGPLEYV